MVDSGFLQKLLDLPDDADIPEYDGVRPSDLEIPRFAMGTTYALILDVPVHIGSVMREVCLFGVEQARRRGKDEWTAMPYHKDTALEAYLHEVGWFNGPVTIVSPPCPGSYVCLTAKGLEALVVHFPSDPYKKRKENTKRR